MARGNIYDSSGSGPSLPPMVQPGARASRYLLLGGVAVACALGVGMGLWARPAGDERRMAVAQAPAMTPVPPRQLRIVVDDRPAPITAPIEVLPPSVGPVPPPEALVRVQVIEPPPEHEPPKVEPPKPAKIARPAVVKAKVAPKPAPVPAAVRKVKLEAPANSARLKAVKAKVVKASPAKLKAADKRLAKAQSRSRPKIVLAKVEPRQTKAQTKLEKARLIQAKVEKARVQKVKLVRDRPAAKAKPAKLQKVAAVTRRPAVKARPQPAPRVAVRSTRPVGLMKVSTPTLSAAEQRMSRAYRAAQAAGVPDWRLQQQQQRWLAARAAAAKEAPWAVQDVYQARIAELNGLARDAGDSGY